MKMDAPWFNDYVEKVKDSLSFTTLQQSIIFKYETWFKEEEDSLLSVCIKEQTVTAKIVLERGRWGGYDC